MQDASLQEAWAPVQDRTRENLCSTDHGIVLTRRLLLQGGEGQPRGQAAAGPRSREQHVRSCAIVLPRDEHFKDGARHGLFRSWIPIR